MATIRWVILLCTLISSAVSQNPSILEDARVHPTSDGSFGFLYRTQDGIQHAAKGVPGGAVQGRFTYTDPTGLKVNFNYNAGAQALKDPPQEPQPQYQAPPQPRYQQRPAARDNRYTDVQYEENYQQPAYEPRPRYNPPPPPPQQPQRNNQPQYRPRPPVRNDIYDYDYDQRYRQ